MKNIYMVCYDITDPVRWRKIFKIMKGFGDPIQFSVFRCALEPETHLLMVAELKAHMNQAEDKVLIINVGPLNARGDQAITILGKPIQDVVRGPIIM